MLGQVGAPQAGLDAPIVDTAEMVYISSLALLKMLKHGIIYHNKGRAGVPMEVMGLMLGEFVDDYTVRVIDVFAMPQSGTGVSVEAVDPVFQTKMLDMLKQTGRQLLLILDQRWLLVGIIHILVLDVGCPVSMSIHSKYNALK
jgi:26S proteasome regulatory subunit N11